MKKIDSFVIIFWMVHLLMSPLYVMLAMFVTVFIIGYDIHEHHTRDIPEDIIMYLKDFITDMGSLYHAVKLRKK